MAAYTWMGQPIASLTGQARVDYILAQQAIENQYKQIGDPTQTDLLWDDIGQTWVDKRTGQQASFAALQRIGLIVDPANKTVATTWNGQPVETLTGQAKVDYVMSQASPQVLAGNTSPEANQPTTSVDTNKPPEGGIDPGTVVGNDGEQPTIPTETSGGTPVGPGSTGPGPGSIPTPQAPPEPDWAALLQKILDLGAPQAPNVSIQFPEQEQLVAPPNPMDDDILGVMRKVRQDAAMRQGYRAAFVNGPRGIGGPSMEAWNSQLRESPGTLPGGGADAVMGRGGGEQATGRGGPQFLGPPVQAGEELNPLRGHYPSMPASGQPNPFSVNPEAINSLANQASPVGPDLQKVAAGTASAVKNRKRPSDYLADEGGMTRRLF